MRTILVIALFALSAVAFAQQSPSAPQPKPAQIHFHEPNPFNFDDHTGFIQIFDGKTLTGWDGDPAIWRVEDGAIVGESSSMTERPPNTYISYHGPDAIAHDFDLKLRSKWNTAAERAFNTAAQSGSPGFVRGRDRSCPSPRG